jgi:hypothetical protein
VVVLPVFMRQAQMAAPRVAMETTPPTMQVLAGELGALLAELPTLAHRVAVADKAQKAEMA